MQSNAGVNILFQPWRTANKDIKQTNMITDIASVDDIKCLSRMKTTGTQAKSIASPQRNL